MRTPLFAVSLLGAFLAEEPLLAASAHNHCAAHILHHETLHTIPSGLLYAVAQTESGLKNGTGRRVPWPWTVNAQGQGYYFATKEAAIAAVQALYFKGIRSIDVGCMQINLHHHPTAFRTLDEAFDPATNVAYAALFLKRLKQARASWHTAVAHYHSANPIHHVPYRKAVLTTWRKGAGKMIPAVHTPTPQASLSPERKPVHVRKKFCRWAPYRP